MQYDLIIEPVGRGKFSASLDGEVVVASTHEPLLAGARALLSKGASPSAVITTRHAGSAHISMRAAIGAAAKLMTVERKAGGVICFAKWQPFSRGSEARGAVS